MLTWWCAIAAANVVWCAVLWAHRRDNHPWTFPVYAAWVGADTTMLVWHLTAPTVGQAWVFAAAAAWMSWFALCLLAAVRLWSGRVPWLLSAAVAVTGVLVAGSEMLGASASIRRTLMHAIYEPLCLIGAFIFVHFYVKRIVKSGCKKGIDFLAFMIRWTSITLLLKLGLMLDEGLLVWWIAYAFHVLFMTTIIVYYTWKRKYMIPWLFYRS